MAFSALNVKNIFTSKLVISWLVSYLVVFSIPLISNVAIYHNAESAFEQEIYNADSHMLETLQLTTEDTISGISSLVMNIYVNSYIEDLLSLPKNTVVDPYKPQIFKLAKNLNYYKTYNKNINDIYIYFNNLDLAVSSGYASNPRDFFDYYYKNSDFDYEQWYKDLQMSNYAHYNVVTTVDGHRALDFMYTVPMNSVSVSLATIVIRVEESVFHNIIMNYGGFESKSLYILDNENKILMSYGKNVFPEIKYDSFPDDKKMYKENDLVTTSILSDVNKWKYISATPKKIINKNLIYLRTLIFINYLISLLVGGGLVYYFLTKNYKPIKNIISICKDTDNTYSDDDEYSMINNLLQDYVDTKSQFKKITYEHDTSLKTIFLNNLLTGKIDKYDNIEKEFGNFDIKFISNYFSVILFKIINPELLFTDDEIITSDKRNNMIRFIMTNVVEELVGNKHKGHIAEVDGQIVCIVSFDENNMSSCREDMENVILETKEFIKSNFEFSFTACMSNIHHYLEGISEAYKEAKQTLRYRSQLNNNNLLFFDDINRGNLEYSFTSEKERQLIGFIRLGNYETAEMIVDNMTESMFETVDVNRARVLILNLISTILRILSEGESISNDIDYKNLFFYVDALTNFQGKEDFEQNMQQLLKIACETELKRTKIHQLQQESKVTSNDDIVTNIKDYIEKNYASNALNIASVGDYFDITPYYASNIFKKSENIGMLDYIGQYRINKAKTLINEKSIQLSCIAKDVGFNNVRTFMRAFVKYEGITPGQYKEMAEQERNRNKIIDH